MDLNTIKSYLDSPRGSFQYLIGVDGFLDFAFSNSSSDRKIRCPCVKCVNRTTLSREDVYDHLVCDGMLRGYRDWIFHGESVAQSSHTNARQLDDDSTTHVNMHQMIHDIFGVRDGEESMSHLSNPSDSQINGSNSEAENFFSLLKDADQNLWPGCELTKLSLIVLLFHTKCTNKWSNKSFNDLLGILQLAIPNGKCLPKTFGEAKKVIKALGLGYEKIHACENNCQLYWKDKANDDNCSVCGASRWRIVRGHSSLTRRKKKGIPAKVLRYFPLKPRLKRLFMSKQTTSLMRWHEEERTKDGALRHSADSEAWKSFDAKHPDFSLDSRNVRFGLASDGFNPFGMLSSTYSCWPVILIPYNLPPWLCMKESSFILSLLVPGPSGPGNQIDVYLQPLIDELKELWEVGINTYDASRDETFMLKAALMWTINDFPAYGILSGWNVHGAFACPCCNIETCSRRLKYGRKYCFMGHRRFLEPNHKFRYDKVSFDGTEEFRTAPSRPSGTIVLDQLEEINNFENSQTWKKKSIFFTLPYWKSNLLRHNLDFMHIEKNVFENVYGTLANIEGKSKDNLNARLDLQDMNIRAELHPENRGSNRLYLPPACYAMSRDEKKIFYKFLKNIKVPDGYAGNISRGVNVTKGKMFGLKSHDCHVLMQQLLPISLRGLLSKNVKAPLFDLCGYFRELCSKVLQIQDLDQLDARIRLTLCHLEMIFPPGFFTIMVHLVIHLASEAKIAGPVHYRWMYPIERFLSTLKSFEEHVEELDHLDQENVGHEEGDAVTVEDETGRRTRGKTLLADLWGLPPGHRVVVDCNAYGQPIGNEGGLLGQFLGTIARNGGLCSLSHKDWRYVKKEKELDILNQVKKEKHPERQEPTRAEVYLKTHKYKTGDFVNDKLAADLQAKIIENQESSNSKGRVAWEGDAYSDVIGKDKYGYMRGVGLGPSPTELLKPTISRRFDGIQITTLDETLSERNMRQMKDEIEKLQQQLQSQNETIMELKNKMQDLEPNDQST